MKNLLLNMKNLLLLLMLSSSLFLAACTQSAKEKVAKANDLPVLRFQDDGTFKIVQFTDLHLKRVPESDIAYECVNQVLDAEKPDLTVFTGDIIAEQGTQDLLCKVVQLSADRSIPFAVAFGNHDWEQGQPNDTLYEMMRKIPFCIMPERGEGSAARDFALPVQSHAVDSVAALIYIFDSNAYSQLPGVEGYAYVDFEQVAHYRALSTSFTAANGGKPLPAVAYMHIPVPEYTIAWNDSRWPRYGLREEDECAAKLNTGLFAAFRERGDVMGMFCGHDHINDYAVAYYDLLLAYGRFSGGNTVYNGLPGGNGARIVVLHEGERSLDTWIRTAEGVSQKTSFPKDYMKQ